MKIRDINLGDKPVLLAPMEDVTDQAFRLLCKEFGASMVYSEFVSADALIRNVNRSLEKIRVDERERPVAIQIYGQNIDRNLPVPFPRSVSDVAHQRIQAGESGLFVEGTMGNLYRTCSGDSDHIRTRCRLDRKEEAEQTNRRIELRCSALLQK